jgi:cold shock CspA family protein
VKLNPSTLTSDVLVSLKDTSRSDAIKLKEGDRVTFEGTFDDWGSLMPVTLDHGIIINN